MEMRACYATRCTHGADNGALLDPIADFHVDSREVAVHRHESETVIDEERVAIEEEVADIDDDAGSRRLDRRAGACGNVHSGMRISRLIVEYSPRAERIGTLARNRR